MKPDIQADIIDRISNPLKAIGLGQATRPASQKQSESQARPGVELSPAAARRILISLMFPSMLMPLVSSMSRVALPVIRNDFQIQADMTAWVASVFTLPFMILMPVYGRLSDGLGKRRLIMAGIIIFALGTALTLLAPSLTWLMVGRAVQGIGVSGMMPLGMALISTIFPTEERGKALGTWSSVGPTIAFLGPLAAGFLVAWGGWRAAFAPPLLAGLIAFIVVYRVVPAGLSVVKPDFLRTFDWTGVILLSAASTSLLFYLSSRPITGVAPLQDWRLLGATLLLLVAFVWWEKQREAPFIALGIFRNKIFSWTSLCASMRMFSMGGMGFLVPLYLVDIHDLHPAYLGVMLMLNPGAMMFVVRFGGQIADRWGSRWPVLVGLTIQMSVMLIFWRLPSTAPIWVVGAILAYHGLGAGLMLAALHRSAMGTISDKQMGAAAGIYSMIRFAGAVVGTALAGVILQLYLDRSLPAIEAYQVAFLFFAGIASVGLLFSFGLREPQSAAT